MNIFNTKDWLVDLVFPRECLGCNCPETYLCHNCLNKIEFNRQAYCVLCKKQTVNWQICDQCQTKTALQAVFVVTDYNNKLLQSLLHNLKYGYIETISEQLTALTIKFLNKEKLLKKLSLDQSNTVVTYVPLHKKRLLQRGFNQSELLARGISQQLNMPEVNLLKRVKNTVSQVKLKRSERLNNLNNAFSLAEDIDKNKKVIIIDDVLTTGSTLNECAGVLYKAGIQNIYGLVIAQRDD